MGKIRISVIGLGFVGLSLAVVNSVRGFHTIGVDINEGKINSLNQGKPDIYEPNLEKYLKKSLKSKNLELTTDIRKAIINSNLIFLTVGTPSTNLGTINLDFIREATKQIHAILKEKSGYHVIVIKSTVIPQTTQLEILPILQDLIDCKTVDVLVNPEFLREGSAINDLENPHLVVIGEYNKKSGMFLEKYYRSFYSKAFKIIHTNLSTAEMIKYANNAFLATKISFINSIANICQKLPNTDVTVIAAAIGKDPRIGPSFLNAGPGFGGSCLPKDISALLQFSKKLGNANILLEAVKNINDLQHKKIIELMRQLKVCSRGKTISILGLSFKKGTDDIRSSVSINVVKELTRLGLKIKVHDPMAMNNFKEIFKDKIIYCNSIKDCLTNSDCCIILTDWDEYKRLVPGTFEKNMITPNIIDTRRVLNPAKFSKLNFRAIGLGSELS